MSAETLSAVGAPQKRFLEAVHHVKDGSSSKKACLEK
jgi:hypothetical protein